MKKIGFIGLGAMGLPMAKRLAEAGYPIYTMIHRNPAPAKALEELGAIIKDSAFDVAAESDVLITILPADSQMQQVLLDPRLLSVIKPNTIVLEMTSGSPGVFKDIEQIYEDNHIRILDAPVSGGVAGASNGKLTIMAGGNPEIIEETMDILSVLASKIIHVGEGGAGKAIKAINQMLAAVHMVAASEAIALGEKMGVNLESMHAVIRESSGNSFIFDNKFKLIIEQNFNPGFKMDLMLKDVQIALNEGDGLSLSVASEACHMYQVASQNDGNLDYAAVSRLIRGLKI